jgi:hypothetical protein
MAATGILPNKSMTIAAAAKQIEAIPKVEWVRVDATFKL